MNLFIRLSRRRIGRLIMAALAAAAGIMMAEHILPEKASGENIGEIPDVGAQEQLRQPVPDSNAEQPLREPGSDGERGQGSE